VVSELKIVVNYIDISQAITLNLYYYTDLTGFDERVWETFA
jgi:hypothetical protein